MKKISGFVLGILLCLLGAGCAAAQASVFNGEPDLSRVAVTQIICRLYAAPQEDADVLIEYFPGVRVEVIGEIDDTYVQVNAADGITGISGYMRKDDLTFGEAGMREARGVLDADTSARLLGWMWAEIEVGTETRVLIENMDGEIRFVPRSSELNLVYATSVDTAPVEGELSLTDAIAFAKRQILADHESGANLGQGMDDVTAEGLERCQVTYWVIYDYESEELLYVISFLSPKTLEYYAMLEMFVQGEEIVRYDYGNG